MHPDYVTLPEHPVAPAAQTVHRIAQPNMENAAGLALREARIALWGDLWRKVERLEKENAELRQAVQLEQGRARRRESRRSKGRPPA